MKLAAPITGRILVRQLRDGFAIVGALRFALDFVPVETALYAACIVDGELRIGTEAIEGPIQGYDRYGSACNWLGQPVWRRTTDSRQFTVRFVEAFPDVNQWTVAGIGSGDLGVEPDAAGHAWFDIANGTSQPIAAPMEARGEALGGVLGAPVWPVRGRELYTTPNLPAWQRPHFVRYHEILSRVGRGECTTEAARAEMRTEDELFNLLAGSIDIDFCRFLAAQPFDSRVEDFGPRSAAEMELVNARSSVIVRELVRKSRMDEIRELAAQVKAA